MHNFQNTTKLEKWKKWNFTACVQLFHSVNNRGNVITGSSVQIFLQAVAHKLKNAWNWNLAYECSLVQQF